MNPSAQLNVHVKDTEAPKISLSKSEVSNVGASLGIYPATCSKC